MISYRVMAMVLIVVAVLSIALQFHQYRRGIVSGARALTGSLARFGFVVLGVVYLTGWVARWRYAPLVGIGIVVIGFVLYRAIGKLENPQRRQ